MYVRDLSGQLCGATIYQQGIVFHPSTINLSTQFHRTRVLHEKHGSRADSSRALPLVGPTPYVPRHVRRSISQVHLNPHRHRRRIRLFSEPGYSGPDPEPLHPRHPPPWNKKRRPILRIPRPHGRSVTYFSKPASSTPPSSSLPRPRPPRPDSKHDAIRGGGSFLFSAGFGFEPIFLTRVVGAIYKSENLIVERAPDDRLRPLHPDIMATFQLM